MHVTATPTEWEPASPRPKTWSQKLRREFSRVLRQMESLAMRPLALAASNRFLFILGHMRSGSSLLCHLLCNSDDVIGIGEAHHDYRRRSDLSKLLTSIRHYSGTRPLRYRYVLDKIVGVQHVLSGSVLSDQRTRYVFLVREPLATMASLVDMRRRYHDEPLQQLIAFAAENYVTRLTQLMQLAETINDPARSLMLTHRELIEETPTAFASLETFLDLIAPLREEYELLPTTGQPGLGDPSPSIFKGRIDRSLRRNHVYLPAQLRLDLGQCYATCVRRLRENVSTVSPRHFTTARKAA